MMGRRLLAPLSLWALQQLFSGARADTAALEQMFANAEQVLLDMVVEVETAYAARCDLTASSCANSNYDEKNAKFPSPSCPDFLGSATCGDCDTLLDYTVSAVWLPEAIADGTDGNPTDDEVKESICYTRDVDAFMIAETDANIASGYYGERPPQMYYGAQNGAFRIYPGRGRESPYTYDPRKRPWYVAASSGPKDVLLVLDVSGSMSNSGRMGLMQTAANTIISQLTIGDHVGIVTFSSTAGLVNPTNYLMQATAENIATLTDRVNSLSPGGTTNFYAAFERAFDLLDDSVGMEFTSSCHKAILFLTDGEMTSSLAGNTQAELNALIATRNNPYNATIFT